MWVRSVRMLHRPRMWDALLSPVHTGDSRRIQQSPETASTETATIASATILAVFGDYIVVSVDGALGGQCRIRGNT